jgi:hypothetical protein
MFITSNFDLKYKDQQGFTIELEGDSFVIRFKGHYMEESKTEGEALKEMKLIEAKLFNRLPARLL